MYENQASKMNFFGAKEFFTWFLIAKMAVKINLRIKTKNHAADQEIGGNDDSVGVKNSNDIAG